MGKIVFRCPCGAALVVDGCIATEVEHECTKGRHEPGCPCQGILMLVSYPGEESRHRRCVEETETVVGRVPIEQARAVPAIAPPQPFTSGGAPVHAKDYYGLCRPLEASSNPLESVMLCHIGQRLVGHTRLAQQTDDDENV